MRREVKQKRVKEKATSQGLTANYLEPDGYEDEDEGGISISAIKNKFKNKKANGKLYVVDLFIFVLRYGR